MKRTDEMIQADAEIERDFVLTLAEIEESRERDNDVLDGQLDFRDLHRQQYNRAYNKRYYTQNKAYLLAKNKQYRAEHHEQVRQKEREWKERNAEYCGTYQHAYYGENRETILAKKMSAYAVNRAYRQIMAEMEEQT